MFSKREWFRQQRRNGWRWQWWGLWWWLVYFNVTYNLASLHSFSKSLPSHNCRFYFNKKSTRISVIWMSNSTSFNIQFYTSCKETTVLSIFDTNLFVIAMFNNSIIFSRSIHSITCGTCWSFPTFYQYNKYQYVEKLCWIK